MADEAKQVDHKMIITAPGMAICACGAGPGPQKSIQEHLKRVDASVVKRTG